MNSLAPLWNVPNALSLVRLVCAPLAAWGLIRSEFLFCEILVWMALLTDGLDGLFARFLRQQTPLGASLDPLADKIFFGTVFLTMAFLNKVPLWFCGLVLARDVGILLGLAVLRGLQRPVRAVPTIWGKLYTAALFVLCLLILRAAQGSPLALSSTAVATQVCAVLLGVSFISYLKVFVRALRQPHGP